MKQFQYFILNKLGNSYYVDENGRVKTTSSATPIVHAPRTWASKKIMWGKSATYLGFDRVMSEPLDFTMDGATILRHIRYSGSVESYARLVIVMLDKSFGGGLVMRDWCGGEIDFSKWNDQDDTVQTMVKDGGMAKQIKANENTDYAIEVADDPDAVTIKMDGIYLGERHRWLVENGLSAGDHLVGVFELPKEGLAAGFVGYNVFARTDASIDFATDLDYFFATSQAIFDIRIQGTLKFQYSQFASGTQRVYLKSSKAQSVELGSYSGGSGNVQIDIDETFNSEEGEKWFFYVDTPVVNASIYQEGSELLITFKSRYPTTYIKGLPLTVLFQRLLDKLTGQTNTPYQSTLLAGLENIIITSGDAIRGIEHAKIKISFANFIKSLNVPFPCGFSVEQLDGVDTMILERYSYFFQNNEIAHFGDITAFANMNPDEFMGNKVEIGWPTINYDSVNGRDEFNVKTVRTSPITRIVKVIDRVAWVRADAYGTEMIRINLDGKTTTDNEADNDAFFLDTVPSPHNDDGSINLWRGPYEAISGILDPATIFNVRLSPRTCLEAHASEWRSIFYGLETEFLKFQTSDKNGELSYTLNGKTYAENADVMIGNFADAPLWLPYAVQFQTQIPTNMIALMAGINKYGKIRFTYKENEYTMFVLEASQSPADNEKQTIKGLLCAENDITKLIR